MSEPNAGSDMAGVSLPRDPRRQRLGDQRQQVLVHLRGRRGLSSAWSAVFDSDSQKRQGGMKSIAVEKPRGELPEAGVAGQPHPEDRLPRLENLGAAL